MQLSGDEPTTTGIDVQICVGSIANATGVHAIEGRSKASDASPFHERAVPIRCFSWIAPEAATVATARGEHRFDCKQKRS